MLVEEGRAASGMTQVSDDVFVSIARICLSDMEGVARLAAGPARGLAGLFRASDAAAGVRIEKLDKLAEDRIVLDVHLAVEEGASIPKVCRAVQQSLKETIETMLNKEVVQVNVYVEGIEASVAEEMPMEVKQAESETTGEAPRGA